MNPNDSTHNASPTATLAALLLFIVWGGLEIAWEVQKIPPWLSMALFVGTIFLPPIGLCVGWIKSFPRWVYPYVGGVLLMAFYMQHVATPGFLFGKELWGWRAWVPLFLVAVISLLATRSLRPLFAFVRNIWNDWTLATFAMCGCLPLLVLMPFDETEALYSMIMITLLMLGMVTLYMQSHSQRNRGIVLSLGLLSIILLALIGPIQEWHGVINQQMLRIGALVFAIMFSPILIGVLRSLGGQRKPV